MPRRSYAMNELATPPIETYAPPRPMAVVSDGRAALSDAVRRAWIDSPDLRQIRVSLSQGLRPLGAHVSSSYRPAAQMMSRAADAFRAQYSQVVRGAWHEVF